MAPQVFTLRHVQRQPLAMADDGLPLSRMDDRTQSVPCSDFALIVQLRGGMRQTAAGADAGECLLHLHPISGENSRVSYPGIDSGSITVTVTTAHVEFRKRGLLQPSTVE